VQRETSTTNCEQSPPSGISSNGRREGGRGTRVAATVLGIGVSRCVEETCSPCAEARLRREPPEHTGRPEGAMRSAPSTALPLAAARLPVPAGHVEAVTGRDVPRVRNERGEAVASIRLIRQQRTG
jgi:hypothetical protein